jgi:hypothetical protein
MLRGFQKEREDAASAWRGLSLAMAKKRGLALRSFSEGGR